MKEDKLQEIKALVNLVDDPDELIYNQIKSKIISMGKEVIPMLESAWEFKQEFGDLFDDMGAEEIEDGVTEINYPVIEYPSKITSLGFDKNPKIEGTLLGIKGQYLIFDVGVINIRKHQGYKIKISL